MIQIRSEMAGDAAAIENVLDESFGPKRRMKTAERLREGRAPADGLSLVATDGQFVIGTIRMWHIAAGDRPALLLGPVAVREAWRGQGIGSALIESALDQAATRGHRAAILVGDAPYYGRFEFSREPVLGLSLPGPVELDRFLGLELQPGALAGASGMVRGTGFPSAVPSVPALVDTEPAALAI